MDDASNLISAVASILWPVLGFVVLFLFRREIRRLFERVRRGKIKDLEFEFDATQLEKATEATMVAAEQRSRATSLVEPQLELEKVQSPQGGSALPFAERILQSLEDPDQDIGVALVRLEAYLHQELRNLLATLPVSHDSPSPSMMEAAEELDRLRVLPPNFMDSLRQFSIVCKKLVHGGYSAVDRGDVLRAIDSGLSLLGLVQAVPRQLHVVVLPRVELYEDKECNSKRHDVRGVQLETISEGGLTRLRRVFPTTRLDYEAGQYVSWDWNSERKWGESWYRNPDTGEVELAWSSAIEFAGRPLPISRD